MESLLDLTPRNLHIVGILVTVALRSMRAAALREGGRTLDPPWYPVLIRLRIVS